MSEVRARLPFTSVEVQKLVMRCGAEGIGVLYALEEHLFQTAQMESSDFELIAYQLRIDVARVVSVVEIMLEIGIMMREGDTFQMRHVIQDLQRIEENRKKWREKKKGKRSPEDSPESPGGIPGASEDEDEHEEEHEHEDPEGGSGETKPPKRERAPVVDGLTWVRMTPEEHQKLKTHYARDNLDAEMVNLAILKVEEWLDAAAKAPAKAARKRPSHYRTLLDWPRSRMLELALDRTKLETERQRLVNARKPLPGREGPPGRGGGPGTLPGGYDRVKTPDETKQALARVFGAVDARRPQ